MRGDGRGGGSKRPRPGKFVKPIDCAEGKTPTRNEVPLWDFSGGTTPEQRRRASSVPDEPSPVAELRRSGMMCKIRSRYTDACKEVMHLERPPADSVDRWLLEQLALPRVANADPLLAKPQIAKSSRVLLRELLAEVPIRCPTRSWGKVARAALGKYVDNVDWWTNFLGAKASALRCGASELREWLTSHEEVQRCRPEDCPFKRKFAELAMQGGLSHRLRMLVEPLAVEVVNRVCEGAEEVLVELSTSMGAPQDEEVRAQEISDGWALSYADDSIPVSTLHFKKLSALYETHNGSRPDAAQEQAAWDKLFHQRLYVMLRRYVTFIGLDPGTKGSKGGNMHAAAPESVFKWLKEQLGVQCECFASPLNCYFANFFSAFPDADGPFGSRGSFFEGDEISEGSFEVGPPYTEEVLLLTAQRLLSLLQRNTGNPLSFVLFVPDWEGAEALTFLEGPAFKAYRRTYCGAYALADAHNHEYISGVQFFPDAGADAQRRYYVVPHGTRVYVLQNDQGAAKWPFTREHETTLLGLMRP